ncbi:MAG: hypothetical protein J6A01_12910 [Proteobacteria bacterium]|nr:hypothetical protein [Pseudomonadota bacterium]
MAKFLRYIILLLLGLTLSACASTPKQKVAEVSRARDYAFDRMGDDPRAVYIPKGAYIIGLKNNDTYARNGWVRFLPGSIWPQEEPKPTVLAGRIAERTSDAARIEVLAVQPGVRDPIPQFEAYSGEMHVAQELHAITKRLIFPASESSGKIIPTELTTANLIEGTEIYGAFELNSEQRLASQCSALLRAEANASGNVSLKVLSGKVPESPAFVLLDAIHEPAFDVRIVLGNANHSAVSKQIAELLKEDIPGKEHIQIQNMRHQNAKVVIHTMGQTQTETIDVELFENDDRYQWIDQGLRVTNSPFGVVLNEKNDKLAAIALVTRAFLLLGYPSSAAWILENAWNQTDIAVERAAIAPALAQAYRNMERDDWALEIALELKGYAELLSKKEKTIVLASAAVSASAAGTASEFENIFNEVHAHRADLPQAWLKAFAHASLLSGNLSKWREYYLSAARSKDWNEFDDLYACMFRGEEDEDLCEPENVTTDFSRIWLRTMQIIRNEHPSEMLEIIGLVDDIGAPNLAVKLWSGFTSMGGEAAMKAWLNAAQYALRAQQYRHYLRMMVHYALERNNGDVYTDVISGLRALDWRTELAHLCVMRSAFTPVGEAIELLNFASELYLSMGDPENAAIALARLACEYQSAGQDEMASKTRQEARKYGRGSHQKEVLQALEDNSCTPTS